MYIAGLLIVYPSTFRYLARLVTGTSLYWYVLFLVRLVPSTFTGKVQGIGKVLVPITNWGTHNITLQIEFEIRRPKSIWYQEDLDKFQVKNTE